MGRTYRSSVSAMPHGRRHDAYSQRLARKHASEITRGRQVARVGGGVGVGRGRDAGAERPAWIEAAARRFAWMQGAGFMRRIQPQMAVKRASQEERVQRVDGDTRMRKLTSSVLRNALREDPGDVKSFRRVLYQPAVTVDPNDPNKTVEAFVRVTLEVAFLAVRPAPAGEPAEPSTSASVDHLELYRRRRLSAA